MLRVQALERQHRHKGWPWIAALAAGLALRAVFVHFHARFAGDTLTYGDLAHNMLVRHIFGFTEDTRIRPTLIRLPGYPLFLAACSVLFGAANYLAVLWVQVLLDLITCVLLAWLAGRLMGRRAALATLWLAALCPFTANYAAEALTETWSLFCVTLAFFALERWTSRWRKGEQGTRWVVAIGLACSWAVLLRPDQGLLAAAVIPAMLWIAITGPRCDWTERLRPAAIASAIVLLPLAVWAGRNWHTFHVFQPLAPRYANDPGETVPFGFQRWYRTWAIDFDSTLDVYWKYDGDVIRMEDLPPRAFDTPQQRLQTQALLDAYNQETSATPAFDRSFAALAADRVRAHPVRYYVLLPLARDLDMWLRPRTETMKMPVDWWRFSAHPRRSVAVLLYGLLDVAYLGMGIAGLWIWRRNGWSAQPVLAASMVAFCALRFALLLTLDNSEPRYTLECFPIVILCAGLLLAHRRTSATSSPWLRVYLACHSRRESASPATLL
jgi:4-amino-4-deoxy-L-arabinose transferase-like glycosyltransferase